MSKLGKIAGNNSPESLNTALSEGLIIGWIPGEITDLNDPEGLGRIQVRSDVIAEDVNLPNTGGGLATVMEEFVCNAQPGGAHKFLQVGTQVAMLPMLGSPSQLLIIGCLPSRVDRPHPELNRAHEKYGTATPGQVFSFHNDKEASHIQAYPHGVVQQVSGQGDLTLQTEKEASLQLKRDGTAKIENPKAVTVHTPDGAIVQHNSGGAAKVLKADGTIEMVAKSQAALSLAADRGQLTGPPSQISRALLEAQKQVGGYLGLGKNLLNQLQGISKDLGLGGDLEALLFEASAALGQLERGLGATLEQGIAAIDQLGTLSIQDLGEHLLPQIEAATALKLPALEPLLKAAIDQVNQLWSQQPSVSGNPGDAYQAQLLAAIVKVLPADLVQGFNPTQIGPVLAGLNHSATAQLQATLEHITPEGFPAVKNLTASGLLPTIKTIDATLKTKLIDPTTQKPYEDQEVAEFNAYIQSGFVPSQSGNSKFEDYYQQVSKQAETIQKSVPDKLKGTVNQAQVLQTITRSDGSASNSVTEEILGGIHAGTTQAAGHALGQIKPALGATTPLRALVDGLQKNDRQLVEAALRALSSIPAVSHLLGGHTLEEVLAHPDKILSGALDKFASQLQPLLSEGMKAIDNLTKAIPADVKGALVRALGTNSLAAKLLSGKGMGVVEQQLQAELAKAKAEVAKDVQKLLEAATLSGVLLGAGQQAALKVGSAVLPPLQASGTAHSTGAAGGIGSLLGNVSTSDVASLAITAATPGGGALLGAQAASSLLGGGGLGGLKANGHELIEAFTSKGTAGAHFRVTPERSALLSPRGKTQLFASTGAAGISTPWGEFGLGEAGGSFFSQAKMAMKVLEAGGRSAGLLMHPKQGVSLSAFAETGKTANGDPDLHDWSNETARVQVEGDTVRIQSLPPANVDPDQQALYTNSIVVNRSGIFINDIDVRRLAELPARFALLEQRLAALEVASTPAPGVSG